MTRRRGGARNLWAAHVPELSTAPRDDLVENLPVPSIRSSRSELRFLVTLSNKYQSRAQIRVTVHVMIRILTKIYAIRLQN